MSTGNFVFNFRILVKAVIVFEIICESQIYIRDPAHPYTSSCMKKYTCTQNEYLTISNCTFNFNFLHVVASEIIGGPKFTLGALGPGTPLEEKF